MFEFWRIFYHMLIWYDVNDAWSKVVIYNKIKCTHFGLIIFYHLKHAARKHAHFQKCDFFDIDYQMDCEILSQWPIYQEEVENKFIQNFCNMKKLTLQQNDITMLGFSNVITSYECIFTFNPMWKSDGFARNGSCMVPIHIHII
jgi:hypothetical protein